MGVHKAHQYSKRNEQIFNVMKEEFDEMIYKRSNDRFVKEMETRKFVDEQIQKNRSLNSTTDIIKNAELKAEIDAFNSYTQDEEKKRLYLRERNTKHVDHVKG